MNLFKKFFSMFATTFLVVGLILPVQAKVEGDTIILGAAVSLSGKYSTNGEHTQNGYNMAVQRINDMGGVTVGGKSYKFDIIYYDD
jgi:branched-chain amino acid transport system substrate-binding protein